jgi:hypothetical protein
MSRHPGLNSYIREAVEGVRGWLAKGELERLSVIILNSSDKVLERVSIEVGPLAAPEQPLLPNGLDELLRGLILRLQCFKTSIVSAPGAENKFSIEIFKKGNNDKETSWITATEHPAVSTGRLTPLRSCDLGSLRVQLFGETWT